jgi:hypothetical protein
VAPPDDVGDATDMVGRMTKVGADVAELVADDGDDVVGINASFVLLATGDTAAAVGDPMLGGS